MAGKLIMIKKKNQMWSELNVEQLANETLKKQSTHTYVSSGYKTSVW